MSVSALSPKSSYDTARADAFAERFLAALNDSAMVMMSSLGHRVRLFDVMAGAPPMPAAEIAMRAGLAERYVREWLAVMTTARVVDYDAASETWRLPDEHAAFLSRASVPNNLAAISQYLVQIGAVESDLVECFRAGGGLPYERYHRFHEVMAEDSAQTVVHALFDAILPLAPGLDARLAAGIRVADVGCGQGRALLAMAERFPASRFVGYELCAEPVATACALARERGLHNVVFEQRDLAAMPLEGPFDLVTAFDAVHDQRDPAGLLRSIRSALAEDGLFLMQDIAGSSRIEENMDHPLAPLLYAVSTAHCTCVSLGQGGPGLGTMWGEDLAMEMLAEAGFAAVERRRLPHDMMNVYYLARGRA
jgi:SAM-dependent methyltransferase